MPSSEKEVNNRNKKKLCISNTSIYKRKNNQGFPNNLKRSSSSRQLKDLNEMIINNKSKNNKEQETWKVVPKDSCEVYRERRKRQNYSDRNSDGDTSDGNDRDEVVKKRKYNDMRTSRRSTRRRKRRNPRRRVRSSSSSYTTSTLTCRTSCSCCGDYD